MARLSDFMDYLDDRHRTVSEVELRLCKLQEKYETFFQEVSKVREAEICQLTEHTLADRSVLPAWFNQELDATQQQVEREMKEELTRLEAERDQLAAQAEELRQSSHRAEQELHRRNITLDREEERLKERNEQLLIRIAGYNDRIRELGRGFGFFANFFTMRRLTAERSQLDDDQADLAARIDSLRQRWQETDQRHSGKEQERRGQWIDLQTESSALAAKIETLRTTWHRMVLRSTIERVLSAQQRQLPEAADDDPPCPRCQTANPAGNHFCHICAHRLGDDRPDFDGSLEEVAEINHHFQRFSDGMRACQELIGLVRGIASGIEAFHRSVDDVRDSERKYPLPKLQIDVPEWSVKYGANFDWLRDVLLRGDLSLHPQTLARQAANLVAEVLTEEHIKRYFEIMGEELSRQAEQQW